MYAGKKLRQLRLSLDVNQIEMAESLELSQSYYSAVESGKRKITKKMIEKIINKYKIDVGYFEGNKIANDAKEMRGNFVGGVVGVDEYLTDLTGTQKLDVDSKEQRKRAEERLKYLMRNSIPFEFEVKKRLLTDLLHNYKKINNLHSDLNNLRIFESIIANLNYYYFSKIDVQFNSIDKYFDNGKFDYEGYKAAYLKELENLEQISPALHKISEAIKTFYKDLEEFDTEDIINGYFGNKKQEKPIK